MFNCWRTHTKTIIIGVLRSLCVVLGLRYTSRRSVLLLLLLLLQEGRKIMRLMMIMHTSHHTNQPSQSGFHIRLLHVRCLRNKHSRTKPEHLLHLHLLRPAHGLQRLHLDVVLETGERLLQRICEMSLRV